MSQMFLLRYVKNKKTNQRRGVVVATPNGVGWSFCNRNDEFDRARAIKIAVGRADKSNRVRSLNSKVAEIPRDIIAPLNEMKERGARYFTK